MSSGDDALRGQSTGDSAVRTDPNVYNTNVQGQNVGREGKDGLGGIPNDAVTRDAKDKSGFADTTNQS